MEILCGFVVVCFHKPDLKQMKVRGYSQQWVMGMEKGL